MKKHIFVIALMLIAGSVYSSDYWTILDKGGNILHVVRDAEDVWTFNGEVFVVEYEDEFVFLDKGFSEILRGSHMLENTGLYDDRMGFYDPVSRKRGYLNGEGKVVIEPKFDYVGGFVNGHAVVGFGDAFQEFPLLTYRLIDTSGNFTSPDEFDLVELSRFEPDRAFVEDKGKKAYRFIKFNGSTWESVPTSKEFVFLKAGDGFVMYRAANESGFGFVSWDGEILTEPMYYPVYSTSSKIGAIVSMGKNWHFVVDFFGNPIEIEVEGTKWHLFDDRYVTFIVDGKTGVYDFIAREIIIPPIYDSIVSYNEGIFDFGREDGKEGFINVEGDVIAEPVYDRVVYFHNGFGMGINE